MYQKDNIRKKFNSSSVGREFSEIQWENCFHSPVVCVLCSRSSV